MAFIYVGFKCCVPYIVIYIGAVQFLVPCAQYTFRPVEQILIVIHFLDCHLLGTSRLPA